MNIYLEAFGLFSKIGVFTIGGGYAMVPLIEEEIVEKRKWIAKDDFIDLLAISQSTPGILAVNISIFIGYKLRGIRGSLVTTLGTILPSFFIILAIALFFHNFKDNTVVERIFKGIRPAVVALIAAPTFSMAKSAKINRYNVWIPIVSALIIWLLDFSPIWVIIIAGVGGYLYGRLLQLFYTFFKIGLFGFGGGYAMLSMIQGEVVTRYGWLTPQEFTDIVAISQMTPGPIGINSATYVGFTATGSVWGSIIATFAVVLPSFILMLAISKFFLKYQKHPAVEAVFSGLRPAVVGLLASAALVLMNTENFSSPKEDMYSFIVSCIIFLVAFVGTRKYKINPIVMIIVCGIAGFILY